MSGGRWFVDRSRYMAGFSCPWRRLLGYHAFGTGITAEGEATPLAVGRAVHAGLEALFKPLVTTGDVVIPTSVSITKDEVEMRTSAVIGQFKLWCAEEYSANRMSVEDAGFYLDTVESLIHLYAARILNPWLFTSKGASTIVVRSVEQELLLKLGDDLYWMARPDLITEEGGKLYVHDFKTSVWEIKQEEWQDSVQMMLNCFAAQATWGKPVGGYYIHGLKKGTKARPTSLTHPYYRPPNPPLAGERFALTFEEAKGHSMNRVRIRDHRDLPSFIWEAAADSKNAGYMADMAKVIGPFPFSQYKVNQFLTGLVGNEAQWQSKLADVDWSQWADPNFQTMLDARFPRTHECQVYNRQCDFYALCFKHDGWQKAFTNFKHREPHHTTEPTADRVWPKGDEPK